MATGSEATLFPYENEGTCGESEWPVEIGNHGVLVLAVLQRAGQKWKYMTQPVLVREHEGEQNI